MFHILAHAGEAHESTVESVVHGLAWYVQIPLFLVGVAFLASVVWLLTKKPEPTVLVTAALLLVSGFGLAGITPIISILAITAGLIATLFSTLIGISSEGKK